MKTPQEIAYFAAVKSDLSMFMSHAFQSIHGGQALLNNWHLEAIVGALEDCITGKQRRLIINLPPRYLKSFISSVVLPAFILGIDPKAEIICASYSESLAKMLAQEFRRIVNSPWYKMIFPNTIATKDSEALFTTSAGGMRFATSVGGSITGMGADFIIIDDPIKPEDTYSDTIRESVNEWFRSTAISRQNQKGFAAIVVVMQRLHMNDLTGVLSEDRSYRNLTFPAIATRDEEIALRLGRIHQRHAGDLLHPEWESQEVLDQIKRDIGTNLFDAQYQQQPCQPEGSMFKAKWFDIVETHPGLGVDVKLYLSIDTAMSDSATADYTAMTLVSYFQEDFYILNAIRGRWLYEESVQIVLDAFTKYGDRLVFVIEQSNVGLPLARHLQSKGIYVWTSKPKYDKRVRAAHAVPIFVNGRVHLLNKNGNSKWVKPFLNEFLTFPNSPHDDWVDTVTQLLPWASARDSAGPGYILC